MSADRRLTEARKALSRFEDRNSKPNPAHLADAIRGLIELVEELRAAVSVGSSEPYQHVAEEPEVTWQWCYVEKWVDGSGVYERVTFDSESKACQYLADAAENVRDFNLEVTEADRIVASVEKRRTWEPGEWEPVRPEGENGEA